MKKEKVKNIIEAILTVIFVALFLLSFAEDYFEWFGWFDAMILTAFGVGTTGILVKAVLGAIQEYKEEKKEKENKQ